MVECWNIGIMGLESCTSEKNSSRLVDKLKTDNILKPNIPSFHYSIIP